MNYEPRVAVSVPPDRDYRMTLMQTKMVYDYLLNDKQSRLMQALLRKKDIFDKECSNLEKTKGLEFAMEYGVKVQAELTSMQQDAENELINLQQDYQMKLNKMHAHLESLWRDKNLK